MKQFMERFCSFLVKVLDLVVVVALVSVPLHEMQKGKKAKSTSAKGVTPKLSSKSALPPIVVPKVSRVPTPTCLIQPIQRHRTLSPPRLICPKIPFSNPSQPLKQPYTCKFISIL